jgi:hypothetical protein
MRHGSAGSGCRLCASDNWLSNRVFKSYDDILDHCCFAWNKLIDMPWKKTTRPKQTWGFQKGIPPADRLARDTRRRLWPKSSCKTLPRRQCRCGCSCQGGHDGGEDNRRQACAGAEIGSFFYAVHRRRGRPETSGCRNPGRGFRGRFDTRRGEGVFRGCSKVCGTKYLVPPSGLAWYCSRLTKTTQTRCSLRIRLDFCRKGRIAMKQGIGVIVYSPVASDDRRDDA